MLLVPPAIQPVDRRKEEHGREELGQQEGIQLWVQLPAFLPLRQEVGQKALVGLLEFPHLPLGSEEDP